MHTYLWFWTFISLHFTMPCVTVNPGWPIIFCSTTPCWAEGFTWARWSLRLGAGLPPWTRNEVNETHGIHFVSRVWSKQSQHFGIHRCYLFFLYVSHCISRVPYINSDMCRGWQAMVVGCPATDWERHHKFEVMCGKPWLVVWNMIFLTFHILGMS